uniref:Uncharacterized protein n=1 Tax=Vespula pensylvanica TaxID=30213 RepID=A0A834P0S9_VESPE|nr:hypothetical protein H0235_008580 [Vespula pensylvanica]
MRRRNMENRRMQRKDGERWSEDEEDGRGRTVGVINTTPAPTTALESNKARVGLAKGRIFGRITWSVASLQLDKTCEKMKF